MAGERRRAGLFEIIGAWLHVWTPPRDVDVPPVPWRPLLLVGVPALALAAIGIWLIVDDAAESKREREAQERRIEKRQALARRERLLVEQAAHFDRAGSHPRPELVAALERAVLEDVRRRTRSGALEHDVRRVDCEPHPRTATRRAAERDPARRTGRYFCLAVTNDIVGVGEGSIGYPFFARIRYRTGALVWCKTNPPPGEQAIPDPRLVAELPEACT